MKFLQEEDVKYLNYKRIAFEEIEDGDKKGIVLTGWLLPCERFDKTQVDILILLPPGYPDTAPDMFHLFPWVKLLSSNCHPRAAAHPVTFDGKDWQRWSRHANEWRPGIDGICTMVKRIENALEIAK